MIYRRNNKYQPFLIRKASGNKQPFSIKKLKNSLKLSGLEEKDCQKIVHEIRPHLKEGMSTKQIFKKSYQLIKKTSKIAATNYSLKRALFELGPAGYYFEDFVAKMAQSLDYQTQVRVILSGESVKHEIDILAHKEKKTNIVECKFHNHQGSKNDIKLVLYVKARMDDLRGGSHPYNLDELWIASNTSFSQDALTYAQFHKIKLLGTNTPSDENLLDLIKRLKLYPITSLKRLKKIYIPQLFSKNIFLVKELVKNSLILQRLGLDQNEIENIISDANLLLEKIK
jgi:hypothetical protein